MYLTTEQQQEILRRATEGEVLTTICESLGFSRALLWQYRQEHPLFDSALVRALDEGVEAQTDQLLTIHETERDPQRARGISDNIKWIAARRKRARYGDSVDINVNERVDLGGALIEARKRAALPVRDQQAIEQTQHTEYSDISPASPSDSESVDEETVDPFS